jgi:hypothetical protein
LISGRSDSALRLARLWRLTASRWYFIVQASLGTGAQQTVMQMDLSGNLLSLQGTVSEDIEGIAVVAP